jgi:hypothetical protein
MSIILTNLDCLPKPQRHGETPAIAKHPPTKPQRPQPAPSERRTAVHEAAHAFVAEALGRATWCTSIEPRGNAGGEVRLSEYLDDTTMLALLAAGRAGEEAILGDVNEIGCGGDDRAIERIANVISQRTGEPARMIIKVAHAQARAIVEKYKGAIRRLATTLQQKRMLKLDEVDRAIEEAKDLDRRHRKALWARKRRAQQRAAAPARSTQRFAYETDYRGVTIRANTQRALDRAKRMHDDLAKTGGMQTAEGGWIR